MTLSELEVQTLRKLRDDLRTSYGVLVRRYKDFEDIYFLQGIETPKGSDVDKNDWKITPSPEGRNKVTGLKRILDSSEIHIKVKDNENKDGKHGNSDKIEKGLKRILSVSGEYRAARVEKDTNLATALYGPCVLTVDGVDDMITAKKKGKTPVDMFVLKQLETIRKRTPFLIGTVNPKESFPEWGEYGLVGHLQEYTVNGRVLRERWGASEAEEGKSYKVMDYFHYDKRLVEADGIKEPLFADTWVVVNENGVTSIPIFVRYAGGSTLFHEPEKQLQSFLYAFAVGNWYARLNSFWTWIHTGISMQGIPGPTVIRDPDDTSDMNVQYKGGVKVLTMKGKLENINIINGDFLQLKNLIDGAMGTSTIEDATIGGNSPVDTFSSYVMQMNAGKLPLQDVTEAIEFCYRDACLHILQRIKLEKIENELIAPEDIPDDVELDVTFEPNLAQDDLRNAQIVAQLKGSGANISDEWLNTNLLKIADSTAMFEQKTKEEFRKAIVANILQNPQYMQKFVMAAMGASTAADTPPGFGPSVSAEGGGMMPPEMGMMGQGEPPMPGGGGEGVPMTDAMPQQNERV